MTTIKDLRIKIFADGADISTIKTVYKEGVVKGFTTNPTLMKKDGVTSYEAFAKAILDEITDLPIFFEVLSDDFSSMEREARKIITWGKNANVKIPITNTKGESSVPLIKKLTADGIFVNITAVLTLDQVMRVVEGLPSGVKGVISIFAGRIADTGRDPVPYMKAAASMLQMRPGVELLWASSRELLNIFQAEACGCHIITVTNDILKKLAQVNKDLNELSLDTVKMFYKDAQLTEYLI